MSDSRQCPRYLEIKWQDNASSRQPHLEHLVGIYGLQSYGNKGGFYWLQTAQHDGSKLILPISIPFYERPCIYFCLCSDPNANKPESWHLANGVPFPFAFEHGIPYGSGVLFAAQDKVFPDVPPEKGWKPIGGLPRDEDIVDLTVKPLRTLDIGNCPRIHIFVMVLIRSSIELRNVLFSIHPEMVELPDKGPKLIVELEHRKSVERFLKTTAVFIENKLLYLGDMRRRHVIVQDLFKSRVQEVIENVSCAKRLFQQWSSGMEVVLDIEEVSASCLESSFVHP